MTTLTSTPLTTVFGTLPTIDTRYIPPIDDRPAQVVATAVGYGRVVVPYDYDLDADGPHRLAAQALLDCIATTMPHAQLSLDAAGWTAAGFIYLWRAA